MLKNTIQKSVDSGLSSWNNSEQSAQSVQETPNPADSPSPIQSNAVNNQHGSISRNRLTSIFSSGGNKLPFSNSSGSIHGSSQQKKGGIHRIFGIKPSKHHQNSDQTSNNQAVNRQQSTNTPALQSQSSVESNKATNSSTMSSDINSIFMKYVTNNNNTPKKTATNESPLVDLSTPPATVAAAATHSETPSLSDSSRNPFGIRQDSEVFYGSINIEQSKTFLDAKKKLRVVLSWADGTQQNFMPTIK